MKPFALVMALAIVLGAFPVHAEDDAAAAAGVFLEQLDPMKVGTAIYLEESGHTRKTADDPIARSLNKCLAKRGDTFGMNTCLGDAYREYDYVMNKIYDQIMAGDYRIDGTNENAGDLQDNVTTFRDDLRESQRKWIAFRDAAFAADDDSDRPPMRSGTVVGIVMGHNHISLIRERIAELMEMTGVGDN